tara:strand:+ start:2561 stop:4783 length:2223 start_codon:yes stop_codon:yes gene_type:complete
MPESRYIEKVPYEFVEQNGRESSPTSPPALRTRTKWEKVGRYNVSVLIIGTLVILMSISFLGFVWIVSITASPEKIPTFWYLIVHEDWTSRVVTLATMLVRIAVAAQLCVFAALLAALILERAGTSTEDLPLLSMIRCANTGPQALIWNVMHTVPKGIQLGYSFLIVITILNALALQFISTLLLADFSNSWVLSATRTIATDDQTALSPVYPIKYAIGNSKPGLGSGSSSLTSNNFWQSGQSSFPSFSEYKHDPTKGATFQDTGLTYRGFLPFNNATLRNTLMTYHGPITVVDERVVCVKPQLSDLIVDIPRNTRNTIRGNFAFNNTHPDVIQFSDGVASFNCSISNLPQTRGDFWQLSLCELGGLVGGLRDGIQSAVVTSYDTETGEPNYQDTIDLTVAWLLINVTTSANFNYTEMWDDTGDGNVHISLTPLETPDGPWAQAKDNNITVDTSLCLMKPITDVYMTGVSSTWDTASGDRLLYWNISKYDTTELRIRFNALGPADSYLFLDEDAETGNLTQEDRGILGLDPVADWNSTRAALKYNSKYSDYNLLMMQSVFKPRDNDQYNENQNDTFLLIPDESAFTIHRSLLWIVLDILSNTRNPALALQSLAHCVMSTAYYDFYNSFDLDAEDPVYTEVETRYVPVQPKHIYVVLALLGLHAVLILIALVLFLIRTEMSLLGNSWQAVAQVMSSDTAEAMHHGTMATDHEVRTAVRAQRIRIARSEQSGRLEAVSVNRRG